MARKRPGSSRRPIFNKREKEVLKSLMDQVRRRVDRRSHSFQIGQLLGFPDSIALDFGRGILVAYEFLRVAELNPELSKKLDALGAVMSNKSLCRKGRKRGK